MEFAADNNPVCLPDVAVVGMELKTIWYGDFSLGRDVDWTLEVPFHFSLFHPKNFKEKHKIVKEGCLWSIQRLIQRYIWKSGKAVYF